MGFSNDNTPPVYVVFYFGRMELARSLLIEHDLEATCAFIAGGWGIDGEDITWDPCDDPDDVTTIGMTTTMTATGTLELLTSGYGLIEGPRVDEEGGLYFSDAQRGGVYRRSDSGDIETVVPKRRGVGGIALHADGGIVISGRNICHVKGGESRVVFDIEDAPGFNDLFTDGSGRVLVGTMRADPFKPDGPRRTGELHRIELDGGGATELYGDISLTNGIGFSPDGTRLYHSDTARRHIVEHRIAADGGASDRRVFAVMERGMPDGLAVDEAGCVWVAAYGGGCATRFTPDGAVDLHVEVPAKSVTSLCFGAGDQRDLYLVTEDNTDDPALQGTIFRMRAETPGLPVPLARI